MMDQRPSARSTFLMEYKQFIVQAFEREPGKWRASVQHGNGKLLWNGRSNIVKFVTAIDAKTPEAAMQMALAAIGSRRILAPTSGFVGLFCAPGESAVELLSEDQARRPARQRLVSRFQCQLRDVLSDGTIELFMNCHSGGRWVSCRDTSSG
jgi:hypothetical protein